MTFDEWVKPVEEEARLSPDVVQHMREAWYACYKLHHSDYDDGYEAGKVDGAHLAASLTNGLYRRLVEELE